MMRYAFYFLLIFAALLSACNKDSAKESANAVPTQADSVAVVVETVREQQISDPLKLTGEVEPLWQVEVFPRTAGKVIAEMVRLGQRVQKDQVLAELIQDIPGMEFTSVKIKAGADGLITEDMVEIGSTVSPLKSVYRISELERVYVVTQVFESMLDKVRVGDLVRMEVDAAVTARVSGRVAEISPVADRVSRTIDVKIMVDNPSYRLKPGMFVVCHISSPPRKGLMAPLDALIRSGSNTYVYVLQQDGVRFTGIETGGIQGHSIEVISGLADNDRVVVVGQNRLQDGVPVRVIEER